MARSIAILAASWVLGSTLAAGADADPAALLEAGRTHYDSRKTSEALESFRRAAELDPTCSDCELWLGRAYLQQLEDASVFKQLGLSKKVRAHYHRAIELDADNLAAREALAF